MKVLMLVTRLDVGGTETYILSVARALQARGIRVGIAAFGGPLVGVCRQSGIAVHILPERNPVSAISSILAKENYSVVHANGSRPYRWVSELPRNNRKFAVIITVHGTYHRRADLKAGIKRANRVIAVSPELTAWVRKLGAQREKILHIPNGIDTTRFVPASKSSEWKTRLHLPKNAAAVVYAGRFSSPKHLVARKMILAAELVAKKHPVCIAVLAGPGPHFPALQQLAARSNRRLGRKAVIVRPAMLRIQHLFWASDIVVGTGRVALEAMACGKPVVAAGTAGYIGPVTPRSLPKAIRCHFGDHSAPVKISVQTLARDISMLLNNRSYAESLGKFGRTAVQQKFSIGRVAKRLADVYRSCGAK